MNQQHLQFDFFIVVLAFGTLAACVIASIAWQRRRAPGALPLAVCSAGLAWWMACYALHLSDLVRPEPLFWNRMVFFGVVAIPPALLTFALQYTNHGQWLNRRNVALLAIEPMLVTLLVWTDNGRGLFFGGWQGIPGDGQFIGGIAFWVHSLYSYLLAGFGMVLLIRGYLRAPSIYRRQTSMIIVGALVPLLGNVLTIFHASPFPRLDLTPLGFVVTVTLLAAALFWRGLLDLIPIARNAVVDRMKDGVLVVDGQNRLVDVNSAARAMLGLRHVSVIGKPVEHALAAWSDYSAGYLEKDNFHDEVQVGNRHIDLRIIALEDSHGRLGGRLVVLRDITPLKRVSAELQEANNRLRQQLQEIESMQKLLKEQAIRDALTGLYNRRFMEETLGRELGQAARNRSDLCVAIIDIDHFKRVNDAHGHGAGDRLLQAIGALLATSTRSGDAACRYGGEEFVVILPGMPLAQATQRVEQWRSAFSAQRIAVGDATLSATFSAGVAAFPAHGESAQTLLHAADLALYAAKAGGRNQVRVAQTSPAAAPDHSGA